MLGIVYRAISANTRLRRCAHVSARYAGVELEINQARLARKRRRIIDAVTQTLARLLEARSWL